MRLRNVRNACLLVREKYGGLLNPISERVDSDVLIYQLPGGMISNTVSQLQEQDALNRWVEVLAEIPRVREDLGYPPLVTPTSQIVGTQAVLNVLVKGERYQNVTKEVKDYIHGHYGKSPAPVNQQIRHQIIGNDTVVTCRPADLMEPSYEKMKAEATAAGLIQKEEDILTYILYPAIAPAFLKGEMVPEPLPRKKGDKQPRTDLPGEMEGDKVDIASITPQKIPRGEFEGGIKSNMQGMVLKVNVSRGTVVKKGDTLIVLEAMKMENPIHSPVCGKVSEIFVDTGDVVQNGDVLLVVQ